MRASLALWLLLCLAPLAPRAAEDPALDKRVAGLAHELRCLVCQNQTLADSNAPLAVDLRKQIREQLKGGASERDVVDFMVARGTSVDARTTFVAVDPQVVFEQEA